MPRIYTVEFNAVAVTAAVDLFEITPADDKPVTIIGWSLDQYSDFGDAQAEQLSLRVIRGFTTRGSGGSSPTPVPVEPNDAAAGFTAETCNTTLANTGTTTNPWSGGWNIQAGCRDFLPEGMQPKATQANTTIVLRQSAPADSITLNGTLWVAEG